MRLSLFYLLRQTLLFTVITYTLLLFLSPKIAFAAPTYETKAAATTTTGTDVVVTKPTGTVEGDVLIAHFASEVYTETLNTPSGWTLLVAETYPTGGGIRASVYYKVAGSSEPANYTFTGNSATADKSVVILRYSGVNTSSPINVWSTGSGAVQTGTPHQFDIPSITTTENDTTVVRFASVNDDGDGGTIDQTVVPADHTFLNKSSTAQHGQGAWEKEMATAGATGVASITTQVIDAGTVDFFIAFNIALNPADTTAPIVQTYSPTDNATGVATTANLVLTFNEATRAGTGTLTIKKASDDSTVETVTVSGAALSGNGTTELTINPTGDLDESTSYYINWHANAFKDASGNHTAALTSTTTWNFTTADESAPTVSTLSPTDGATDVAITANLVITFNESISSTGTGYVTLYKASDDSVVETFAVTGSLVTGSGTATITINPTSSLANNTAYYVQIDANSFPDSSGNFFTGINDKTTWNFTTVAAESNSSSSNDTNNTTEIARGGRRGAGTNQLQFQPIGGNSEQSPHSTNDPLHTLLWNVYARLEERIQRRIAESPHVAPLFERVLERLKMRIEAIIADQA